MFGKINGCDCYKILSTTCVIYVRMDFIYSLRTSICVFVLWSILDYCSRIHLTHTQNEPMSVAWTHNKEPKINKRLHWKMHVKNKTLHSQSFRNCFPFLFFSRIIFLNFQLFKINKPNLNSKRNESHLQIFH